MRTIHTQEGLGRYIITSANCKQRISTTNSNELLLQATQVKRGSVVTPYQISSRRRSGADVHLDVSVTHMYSIGTYLRTLF